MAEKRKPRAANRTRRTPKKARARDWTGAFLEAFRDTGLVKEAAAIAGVGRSTVYERRAEDEAFAAAWQEVEDETTERMEQAARERAVDGVESHKYDKDGNLLWTETRYSDTLLIFLLKARRPNVYREHVKHEHTGPGGGPVKHELDAAVPAVREHIGRALAAAQEAERAPRRD